MKVSCRPHQLFLILLPVTLTACAHRYSELAQTDLPRPPAPSFRLPGASPLSGSNATGGLKSAAGSESTTLAKSATVAKRTGLDSSSGGKPEPHGNTIQRVTHDGSGQEPAGLPTFVAAPTVADGKQPTHVAETPTSFTVPPAPAGSADDAAKKKRPEPKGKPDAEPNSGLSLSDLEAIAVESNPSLMQLAFVVEKARGIHEQVGLYPNPVVGYSGVEIGNEGASGQQGGFIAQTIVTGDKLRLNRDVASWNIQEMCWQYQAQRYRVLNDVRLRFYDVLGAQQRLKIAAELLKVAENGAKIAEQLRKAKQASRADVLQATVDVNQIQIIQQNAKYEYQAAWKRLVAVLGRPQMGRAKLAGSLKGLAPEWPWEPTYQKLLDESPQIQAARARIQGARLAIQRQEAQPIPNILTQLGVARDYGSGDVITNVQIGIPLPIHNRNQGLIRLARAEYQRAVRDVERLELQLRDLLATAFRDFQQARFQVQQYEKNILSNAEESRKLTEDSYAAGQVNFLRVLTARRTYFEANLRYVDAQIALRQANVVIDGFVLTGGLTDVPDIGSRVLKGVGQRGQALGGQ